MVANGRKYGKVLQSRSPVLTCVACSARVFPLKKRSARSSVRPFDAHDPEELAAGSTKLPSLARRYDDLVLFLKRSAQSGDQPCVGPRERTARIDHNGFRGAPPVGILWRPR
jgi:hypothetical protein